MTVYYRGSNCLIFCADVQPAIDKISKDLREVSTQLTRMQPGDKQCRDEIDELRRRLRGEICFTGFTKTEIIAKKRVLYSKIALCWEVIYFHIIKLIMCYSFL